MIVLNFKLTSVETIDDLFHEKILFSQGPVSRGPYRH